jgi:xylan 1,4-beta-xylosidase
VWNEPNCGFFYQCCCCGDNCGNQTAYFELYRNTANALKSVDKNLRVGGPSTAQLGWITEFLNFVKTNNVPVDFVSSHLYPTDPQVVKDANGFSDAVLAAANQTAASDLPFLLTEYNPGLGLGVADKPYSAAFVAHIANAFSGANNNVAAYSFWTFSDIFEEGGQNPNPFYDGFGTETIYSIAKPVYRAFQLLHQLSTSRIQVFKKDTSTAEVVATIEKTNSSFNLLRLLLSNYDYQSQPISTQTVDITLGNIPGQLAATANIRRIDDTHANALPVWQNAGSPTYPNSTLINQMAQSSQLVVEQVAVSSLGNGQYSISVDLPPYGVADIQVNIPVS